MLLPLLGLSVLNAIPTQAITGLLAGTLKITGGVIRYAAGTSKAGQIFMHLLPAESLILNEFPGLEFFPGIIANFQLHKLSGKIDTLQKMTELNVHQLLKLSSQVGSLTQVTQNVLHLVAGTAVLSGLSLAVSSVGFLGVNRKLNAIDQCLQAIQKDVQAIKRFLELAEKAELMAALCELLKVNESTPPEHCTILLNNARYSLLKINKKYQELLANATTINEAMAYEEYFALTALAEVRCSAELRMFQTARQEIDEMVSFWKIHVRRIAKDILLGQHPERFLATDFASDVPVSALVSWMDFAYNDEKGYGWIDELRQSMNANWYGKHFWNVTASGLNKGIGIGIEQEKSITIPTLQKLLARNDVFEGYRAQYELLETRQLRPSEFQQQLAQLPKESAVDGCFVLLPAKTENKEIAAA